MRVERVLAILVLVAPLAAVSCKSLRGTPNVVRALIVTTGERLVVATLLRWSGRGGSSHEVAAYDETGAKIGSQRVASSGSFTLYRPVGRRVFGHSGSRGLMIIDLAAARVVLDEAAIKAKVPALAAGYRIKHETVNDYSPPTHALRLELHDGRIRWLDLAPRLHVERPPGEPWRPGYFCGPDGGARPSCARRHCYAFAAVAGSSGLRMGSAALWGGAKMQLNPRSDVEAASGAGAVLLRPGWVRLLESMCVFEHDGQLLVMHDSAAMEPKDSLLSMLGPDGTIRWSRKISELASNPKVEAFGALLLNGKIHILLGEGRRSKQSLHHARLDPKTGQVEAKHHLAGR